MAKELLLNTLITQEPSQPDRIDGRQVHLPIRATKTPANSKSQDFLLLQTLSK